MRAAQVLDTTGPEHVVVRDVPEPTPGPDDVLVEVHRVGVSFPDLLLTKGEYQLKPEPPFTLGVDFAGTVVCGPAASSRVTGSRASLPTAAPPSWSRARADVVVRAAGRSCRYDEGAAMPMNYLTAQFALAERAGLREGETVLVHGAAGGVGTATIQVAKGYGARTIAVVSTEAKAEVARRAGADEAVLLDGFRDAVAELTGGRGVDVVVDVVGGDVFTDSLRSWPRRAAAGRRVRRRAGHPGGQGQPAAAQQHRRPRRRLGRVRDGPARLHAGAVGRAAANARVRRGRTRRSVRRTTSRTSAGRWSTWTQRRTLGQGRGPGPRQSRP